MRKTLRGFLYGASTLSLCVWGTAQQPSPAHPKTAAETLGYGADARLLVIQAEDLGMAHSIDKASFEAVEKGWVTTAGVLVPGPWFPEVQRWARSHPNADLGIRLDLNSDWSSYRWRPKEVITMDLRVQGQGSQSVDDMIRQHALEQGSRRLPVLLLLNPRGQPVAHKS